MANSLFSIYSSLSLGITRTDSLLLLVVVFISSCAQVVSPDGGPADKMAPRVVKYHPDSAAVNFTGNKIELTFDEYIQLKNINQQLIVSPPLKNQPEIKAKKKSIEIILNDTLKQNTTYSLNFGNAIADVNEANAMSNFKYVFSTGAYIDSLSVSGMVTNAYTSAAEKDVLVMLYEQTEDSVPFKERPLYIGKTGTDGYYLISHVKKGTYKLLALKDVNANYLYNASEEMIGFCDTLISVHKKTSVNLQAFKEFPEKLKVLKKGMVSYGQIEIIFNKPVQRYTYTAIGYAPKKEWYVHRMNASQDTLRTWITDAGDVDTLKIIIHANDVALDTFRISTTQLFKKNQTGGRGEVIKFGYRTNINNGVILPGKQLIIDFARPIKPFNNNSIKFYENNKIIQASIAPVEGSATQYSFPTNFLADSIYSVYIAPGELTDIYGFTNDTLKLKFSTAAEKNFGNFKLTLKIEKEQHYILQLLDEKGNVIKTETVSKSTELNYKFLNPGKYSLRAIVDANNDGRWTTGNYLKHLQPEKVIIYTTPITIRSNWDLEQEWKL